MSLATTPGKKTADNYWDRNNEGIHPLFRDSLPDDPYSDPTLAGLMAIQEDTLRSPEDALKHWKAVGNDHFREGHIEGRLQNAIDAYTKGLQIGESESFKTLRAQLWTNRANCLYKLKDYVGCVEDARHAIGDDSTYIKGYFQAARASLALGLYKQCIGFCQAAAACCGEEVAKDALGELEGKAHRELEKQILSRAAVVSDRTRLEKILSSRGIVYKSQSDYNHPTCGPPEFYHDDELVWSVLFLIKEYSVAEVARVTETSKIEDVLLEMFPEGDDVIRPDWDRRKDYKTSSIELRALKPDESNMNVSRDMELGEIIKKIGVIHQHPVFEVVLKNS